MKQNPTREQTSGRFGISAGFCRRITMPLLVITIFLAAGFCFGLRAHAGAIDQLIDPTMKVTNYCTETKGGIIFVQKVSNEFYLFLPGEADTEHISLQSETANQEVLFSVNGTEKSELSLSELVPSGNKYPVQVIVRKTDAAPSDPAVDSFSLNIMQGKGIGTLFFISDNKKIRGRDYIERKKGNKASGRAVVFNASGKNLTKDEEKQIITDIHGRGNTSWEKPKKGYQIKFDKKIALIDGTKKAKKWILLPQYVDPLRTNDKIAKDIARITSGNYSPNETWINFYYDGVYRGLYLLSEKNEIKEERIDIHDMEEDYEAQDPNYGKNLNIKEAANKYGNRYLYQEGLTGPDEPGGFLIEIDNLDENNGFYFTANGSDYMCNIKSPELGSQEAVKYISEYFQEFCNAVEATDASGKHTGRNPETGLFYYDYCDLDSLVDTYLANCLPSTHDVFNRSQYFYKDKGKKMVAGPIWDIDLGFGIGNTEEVSPECDFLADKRIGCDLIQIPSFRQKVKERYQEVYAPVLNSLISTGDILPTYAQSLAQIRSALDMDNVIWTVKCKTNDSLMRWPASATPEDILASRVDWVTRHKAFLDSYFGEMNVAAGDLHIYSDPVALTGTTHQRSCIYHPEEKITDDCDFGAPKATGEGTHSRKCVFCENTQVEPCEYTYQPAKADKHTKTCSICKDKVTESCRYTYADNQDGTHTKTCGVCGKVVKEGHGWGKAVVLKYATLKAAGSKQQLCACGAKKVTSIPKLMESKVTITKKKVTASEVNKLLANVKAAGGMTGTIILGKNVRCIQKKALNGTELSCVIVKTRKLTKKSVKGSLKGSKVTMVKISVGKKKVNKRYYKKYKKYFTFRNAGKRVKVSKILM